MSSRKNVKNGNRRFNAGSLTRGFRIGLMIMILALAFTGCASLEGKLTPSTKADIGIFADQTIVMLSQADFVFKRNETVYTREFVDTDAPAEKRLYALEDEVGVLIEKILDYSLRLVVIYETHSDDEARIAVYADSIVDPEEDVLRQVGLDRQAWDAIVAEVRKQEKFMQAVETAQPILNALGWYINTVLNEMEGAVDQVALIMEQRIDEKFAEVIHYNDILLDEKYTILAALEQLYRTYIGEKEAYSRLRQSRAIRKKGLVPQRKLSEDEMAAVGKHLMTRLDALHRIGDEIEPEWEIYRAAHQELDDLHDKMIDSIRTARVLTMVWVHAHYQMASGTSTSAEWFDIEKTGMKALKVVF